MPMPVLKLNEICLVKKSALQLSGKGYTLAIFEKENKEGDAYVKLFDTSKFWKESLKEKKNRNKKTSNKRTFSSNSN